MTPFCMRSRDRYGVWKI